MSPSSTTSSDPAATSGSVDGLFAARPEVVQGRFRRLVAIMVIMLFGGVTLGTALVDRLHPAPPPLPLGREKVEEDEMRSKAHLSDGSLARLVEYDLRMTSRVRKKIMPIYAFMLYDVFRETRGVAVPGKQGWFFLKWRTQVREGTTENLAGTAGALVAAGRRRWHAFGTDVVTLPIPRKAVTHPEFLPDGIDPRCELFPALIRDLKARGIRTVDTYSLFQERRGQLFFFLMDTHWNDSAQVLAAEKLSEVMGLKVPVAERTTELRLKPDVDEPGDIFKWLGIPVARGHRPPGVTWPKVDMYFVHDRNGKRRPSVYNPPELLPWTIVGTSFTVNRRLALFIEHFTNHEASVIAHQGVRSHASMLACLKQSVAQGRFPETIIWEFPGYEAFKRSPPMYNFGRFFTELAPKELTVVGRYHPEEKNSWFPTNRAFVPGALSLGPKHLRTAIKPGKLLHSADGVVALRLRGTVTKGSVKVATHTRDHHMEGEWKPGVTEVVLPFIASGPLTGGSISLRAMKNTAHLDLESIEIVSPLDITKGIPATIEPLTTDDGGWAQEARFPPGTRVQDLSGLVLQMHALGPYLPDLHLKVFVRGEDSPAMDLPLAHVGRSAWIVLDASHLARKEIDRLVISGQGLGLKQAIRAVALAPPY